MLWIAQISANLLNLGVKSGKHQASQLLPHPWLKNTLWLPFESPHTNLNLLQPFIILIIRTRCHLLESIRKHTILVWNVGYWSWSCHHPWLKSRGVVMVVQDELKSQPCKTIHYTYNEILEGLRCCELPESVQTHSTLGWTVEEERVNFNPTSDWKTCGGDHFRDHSPISTLKNHSLYL